MKTKYGVSICALVFAIAAGCDGGKSNSATTAPPEAAAAPTNRIDLPETVQRNLGITFARVEPRRVASTLRVPGRFELLPTARREYRAVLPGFVKLLVSQYEQIETGKAIFRLDSPEWHRLKRELHEAEVGIERATAELGVARHARSEAEQILDAVQGRINALAEAEVRRAELETELATRRAAIPRLEAEIKVKETALDEARHDLQLGMDKAASLLGVSADYLRETERTSGDHETQRWYSISHIEVVAADAGLIETIAVTDGAWVEASSLIATSIDPTALRFRAIGLQSDLGRLNNGLEASILPPQGGTEGSAAQVRGKLQLGPIADPDQRTIDLLVIPQTLAEWARPGVSSLLEVVTDGSAEPELAIPVSAVVRDELAQVFFRRDPRDPNKVIRMEADLGVSDGKWVVVKSGVREGDEIVLDGVYELKLSGGGRPAGSGHFHADGTWHAAPDK